MCKGNDEGKIKMGFSIVSKIIGNTPKIASKAAATFSNAAETVKPVVGKAVKNVSGTLRGIRGDVAVIDQGEKTIFARLDKDGALRALKTKIKYQPVELPNGVILRRRLDLVPTKTMNGKNALKEISLDKLYENNNLISKTRNVKYFGANGFNGNYTKQLNGGSHAVFDIKEGKYENLIEASGLSGRKAIEKGTLAYKNGKITIEDIVRNVNNRNNSLMN